MRSNCIIFASLLWWHRRMGGHEGYLTWRLSRKARYCFHVLYAQRRKSGLFRVVSYKPIDNKVRLFPPPLFMGYACWGDLPD
jgi:hypothetical protein